MALSKVIIYTVMGLSGQGHYRQGHYRQAKGIIVKVIIVKVIVVNQNVRLDHRHRLSNLMKSGTAILRIPVN